jgi:hypothetical protein
VKDGEECTTNLLQKVSNTLAIRALKPTRLKKLKHTITRSMIHNLPLREQNDVIKQVKSLGSRLQ